MNAYESQQIRNHYRALWQEEYLIGLVQAESPIGTTGILKLVEHQAIMSPATTHKYLMSAVAKKFLSESTDKIDRRGVVFKLTEKGDKFLEELSHAHVRK